MIPDNPASNISDQSFQGFWSGELEVIYGELFWQIRVVNAFRSVIDGRSQRAIASPAVFNSLLAPVRTAMVYDDAEYPTALDSADSGAAAPIPRYASVESSV